tara:strand:- start:437 stop:730 length:294 start_codon:yes stop_codon:yes gene_type:complete
LRKEEERKKFNTNLWFFKVFFPRGFSNRSETKRKAKRPEGERKEAVRVSLFACFLLSSSRLSSYPFFLLYSSSPLLKRKSEKKSLKAFTRLWLSLSL